MIRKLLTKCKLLAAFTMFGLLVAFSAQAAESDSAAAVVPAHAQQVADSTGSAGEFNAGEMIMEHVVDNHEWHVATIGNLNLTVPLPGDPPLRRKPLHL